LITQEKQLADLLNAQQTCPTHLHTHVLKTSLQKAIAVLEKIEKV